MYSGSNEPIKQEEVTVLVKGRNCLDHGPGGVGSTGQGQVTVASVSRGGDRIQWGGEERWKPSSVKWEPRSRVEAEWEGRDLKGEKKP